MVVSLGSLSQLEVLKLDRNKLTCKLTNRGQQDRYQHRLEICKIWRVYFFKTTGSLVRRKNCMDRMDGKVILATLPRSTCYGVGQFTSAAMVSRI